ncbi:MAG: helix-turn-helix domain-containing protein [Sphingomonadales bacterium]|nr:helix-turn-helix domain-containing protein [Sphingomonadales bacterium]
MAEASNPTSRVLGVLNFLAAHPEESFSLAEIARHLGLSAGSAHRILTTMAAAQFLSRDARRRSYSLGLSAVAVGQAALEKHRGIEAARRELARLAVELNLQCSANAVVDGDLLVVAKEGSPRSFRGLTRVGERRPLVPPLGLCHIAWGGAAALDAYLDAAGPHLAPPVREHLVASLPVIRQRGYTLAAHGPGARLAREASVLPVDRPRDADWWAGVQQMIRELTLREVQILDPAQAAPDGVSHIGAPVFSPSGSVAFQLVATGLPRDLRAEDIERYAERLCAAAATVTDELHGRPPGV